MIRYALVLVAALALAGCGGTNDGATAKPGEVAELSSVDELRDAFREDAGVTRLVVLLSPT